MSLFGEHDYPCLYEGEGVSLQGNAIQFPVTLFMMCSLVLCTLFTKKIQNFASADDENCMFFKNNQTNVTDSRHLDFSKHCRKVVIPGAGGPNEHCLSCDSTLLKCHPCYFSLTSCVAENTHLILTQVCHIIFWFLIRTWHVMNLVITRSTFYINLWFFVSPQRTRLVYSLSPSCLFRRVCF
jgi:hypothetical protein